MDERDEELFAEGAGDLARDAAEEIGAREQGQQADEGIGREADIGVDESEDGVAREAGEAVAGVDFAVPAGGQRRGGLEADAGIARGEGVDDLRGVVVGGVIEDDQLELDAFAREDALDGGGDIRAFVARGDEHGDRRALAAGGGRRRVEDAQIREEERGGEERAEEGEEGEGEQHGESVFRSSRGGEGAKRRPATASEAPCSRWKASPRQRARQRRQSS